MDSYNKENTSSPLARVFRIKDLQGFIGKWIEVPQGYQGIAIDSDGRARTFPPGKHRVLNATSRLRGRGVGLITGYVPDQPFSAVVKVHYILSGDDQLLDASLVLRVEVIDAGQFLRKQVIPRREMRSAILDLHDDTVQDHLAAHTRQYAADDLIDGLPTLRLAREAQVILEPLLRDQGLGIAAIEMLSFWRSEERAEVAERVLALEERLQEVQLQKKMVEVESEAQLNDFIHQLDPDLEGEIGLRALEMEPPDGKGSTEDTTKRKLSLGERFRGLLNLQTRQDPGKPFWRLEGLFHRLSGNSSSALEIKTHRPRRYWWLGRALWMAFVLLMGLTLTRLVNWIASSTSWTSRLEILLAIWAFVIVAVLDSIKVLFERRESLAEEAYSLPGITYIDDLVRNNRQRADRLVRDQSSQELLHVRDILNDLRARVYRAGEVDQALQIKVLERKFEEKAAEVQAPDFGRPVYVTDLKVSRRAWDNLLDYDEDLLLFANALSDKGQALQEKYAQEEFSLETFSQLERELDAFMHCFAGRDRAIQTPAPAAGV